MLIVTVVLGAILIAFFLTRILPGDPIEKITGGYYTVEAKAEMKRKIGLDRPIHEQFVVYIYGLLNGNMGVSFTTAQPVTKDLTERLPATLELITYALGGATLVALPLGVLSAVHRGKLIDQIGLIISVFGISLPLFWLAIMLTYLFFYQLGWLPGPMGRLPLSLEPAPRVTGFFTVDALLDGNFHVFREALRGLALPALTLGITIMAPITRMARASMVDALESDYVRFARAMGMPEWLVVLRYALKNTMLPVVVTIAGIYGYAIGGEVIIEYIFAWPGIGLYAFNAILGSDFPAVQGFIVLVTGTYILLYLLVDIAIALLDPRVVV